jgi:hypothetical protein
MTRTSRQIVTAVRTAALAVLVAACTGAPLPSTTGPSVGSIVAPPASASSVPIATAQASPTPAAPAASSAIPTADRSASPTPGTSARPLPTPRPTSPPSDTRTITLADDGATVHVAIGARVLVKLGTDLVWTVQVGDPAVLVPVRGVALVVGAQGLYTAAKAGSTLVTATGDAACRTAVPPCMVPTRLFSVTVIVR